MGNKSNYIAALRHEDRKVAGVRLLVEIDSHHDFSDPNHPSCISLSYLLLHKH